METIKFFLFKLVSLSISFATARNYYIYFAKKNSIPFLYKYICVSIAVNHIHFHYYLLVIPVINSCGRGGSLILRHCGRPGEPEH